MYLTLPSNSSLIYFPKNEAGHFITKLPQTQDFGGDYEVGLAEIQFSNNYQNVTNDSVWFEYEEPRYAQEQSEHGDGRYSKRVMVPNGLYETNGQFINALNALVDSEITEGTFLDREKKKSIKFKYNPYTKKVSLFHYYAHGELRLSEALMEILGMTQTTFSGINVVEGKRIMDLNLRVKGIFIYSDLVQSRPVGDFVVPLLR